MFNSLRNKMIGLILMPILVVLAASFLVTYLASTNIAKAQAYVEMENISGKYANYLDSLLSNNQMVGRMLAGMMESYISNDRQEVLDMLHNLLLQHPEGLAFYVGYEPNAFDAKDIDYVNMPGHDSSGRFVPYWNRLTGHGNFGPLN